MLALVFLSVIAVSYAQVPQPCNAPKQWEAARLRIDRSKKFEEKAYHAYDEINKRTRSIEEVIEGQQKEYYDRIHLHNENKEYAFNLQTKKCNVSTISRPFRPIGIPPGSNFTFMVGAGAAGIPNEHLTIQAWSGTFEDKAEFFVQLTSPSCFPISLDVKSEGATPEYFHERYFDLKVGISDPERFIPPPECL